MLDPCMEAVREGSERSPRGGQRRHWQSVPNLNCARAHAGVVAAAGMLFVLGGRSQVQAVQQVLPSCEVLAPPSSAWALAPDMHQPRSALAAAAMGGGLFAVGGQAARPTLRSVERFDLGQETWSVLGCDMRVERKYAAAAVLGGRLVVAGGLDECRTRLRSVEALDPREGRWRDLALLSMPRSSCGLAALQVGAYGRLFAAGGSAPGDHVHDTVESWVPEMNAWVPVASMGCGRSGLGLCAL
ncbi:hypothetical protein V8C86DRAFT_2463536 [Haematococcus lacustris]